MRRKKIGRRKKWYLNLLVALMAALSVAPATVFAAALPNLTLYQLPGWSDKVVVTTSPSGITDSTPIYTSDILFVNGVAIDDSTEPITAPFGVTLYVDGTAVNSLQVSGLPAGIPYQLSNGYSIGRLGAGTHTITVLLDSGNSIAESNESDNVYTKKITVSPPSRTLSGKVVSQATGRGIPNATVSLPWTTATTDSSGAFSISGIPPGTHDLTISARGFATYNNPSYAVYEDINLTFALAPAYNLVPSNIIVSTAPAADSDTTVYSNEKFYVRGTVRNYGSMAISMPFSVVMSIDDGERTSWPLAYLAAGAAVDLITPVPIGPLTAGTHSIRIAADDLNSILESDESDNYYTRTITVLPVFSISGTVRSRGIKGRPIPGATVSIAGKTATTDGTGAFTITDIRGGTYTLAVSATGFTPHLDSYLVDREQAGVTFVLAKPPATYIMPILDMLLERQEEP